MSLQPHITLATLPVSINQSSNIELRLSATNLPRRIAIVVARTGTLTATKGIVMADEAMAIAFGRGLLEAGGGHIEQVDVVEPLMVDPDVHDGIFMFHHARVRNAMKADAQAIPAWLWVHNPGHSTTLELRRAARSTYQRIFHAGIHRSKSAEMCYLPHGLEDINMFQPFSGEPTHDVAFVGNAVMHHGLAPFFIRIQANGRRINLRGLGWIESGIASEGPIAMRDAGGILAKSKVCFDHVSDAHKEEGMCSTRIFQCLACGVPVVSTQCPDVVPEELHKHIIFTDGLDSAMIQIERLLCDSVARARLRDGARSSIRGHAIADRARQAWSTIMADISSTRNKGK